MNKSITTKSKRRSGGRRKFAVDNIDTKTARAIFKFFLEEDQATYTEVQMKTEVRKFLRLTGGLPGYWAKASDEYFRVTARHTYVHQENSDGTVTYIRVKKQ